MSKILIAFLFFALGFGFCWQGTDRLIREMEDQITDDRAQITSLRAAAGLPRPRRTPTPTPVAQLAL